MTNASDPPARCSTACWQRASTSLCRFDGKVAGLRERAGLRNAVAEHETALRAHIDSLRVAGCSAGVPPAAQQALQEPAHTARRSPVPSRRDHPDVERDVHCSRGRSRGRGVETSSSVRTRLMHVVARSQLTWRPWAPTMPSRSSATSPATLRGARSSGRRAHVGSPTLPALSVSAREKSFPLTHVGVARLRLDIVNAGPGQARDVDLSIEGQQHIALEDTTRSLGLMAPGTRRVVVAAR